MSGNMRGKTEGGRQEYQRIEGLYVANVTPFREDPSK